ncbi:hypothetical protein GYMLUDRAFT_100485 [Collybiopsis luxurians FD-317 M1]|uniref:Uncharacterized protein n=1 Tax=Collybiopsis luxurians FD-317 M1 TaxID=944289 RepID=A0A0D0BUC8_9AGAR|nr:hypothetical protein GYMLUDRAFT_100485 [Collybiopsis luxurians FD-317 M1]
MATDGGDHKSPSILARQQDSDSLDSDSEPEGPDIYTDAGATSPATTQRGPSSRYRRRREYVYSETSPPDLLRLLIDREYELSNLRKALESTQRRAEEAERQLAVYSERFQSLNEDRVTEKKLHMLEEELTMYKIRYELAQKEIEMWKVRDEGRRTELEVGLNRAREDFEMVAADLSQSEYQETVNKEQPLVKREEDEAMSYRVYPLPRTLFPFLEVPVVPPPGSILQRKSALRREPAKRIRRPSTPYSRPTLSTPALQMYDVEIPPADQVEIDDKPSEPDCEASSTAGDTASITGGGGENPRALSGVLSGELTAGVGGGEHSRASSTVGTESITEGGGEEQHKSTIGDIIWSEIQAYAIGVPPAEQVKSDSQPPEPVGTQHTPVPGLSNYIISVVESEDGHVVLPPPYELAEHPLYFQPRITLLPPQHRLAEYPLSPQPRDFGLLYPPSPHPSFGMTLPPQPSQSQQGVGDRDRTEYTFPKGKVRAMELWDNQQGEVDLRERVVIPLPDNGVGVGSMDLPSRSQSRAGKGRDSRRHARTYAITPTEAVLDAGGVPIQLPNDSKAQKLGGWGTIRNVFMNKRTGAGGGKELSRNENIN